MKFITRNLALIDQPCCIYNFIISTPGMSLNDGDPNQTAVC